MNFDNTVLEKVAECSTRVATEYILHRRPLKEAGPLKAGSAGHTAMEVYFQTGDETRALQAFDIEYKDWAQTQLELEDRLSWGNVRQCLENWFFLGRTRVIPWKTLGTEIAFKIEVWKNHFFTGLIDIRGEDPSNGMLIPVDHKTTGRLDGNWARKWRYSSQMTGYIFAEEILFKRPVFGAYINAIDFKKIPGSSSRCRDHGVKYSECGPEHLQHQFIFVQRTEEQKRAWWNSLVELAGKLEYLHSIVKHPNDLMNLPQEGTFNGSCRFCPFYDFCHVYNRRPEALEAMTQESCWDPLEGRTVMEGRVG